MTPAGKPSRSIQRFRVGQLRTMPLAFRSANLSNTVKTEPLLSNNA
jgi:hypothetical protein